MEWNVANFIALSVVLAVLATTSVALRFWAHTKSGNRSGPDGFLIILALLGVIGMAVTEVIGTQVGGMAQHQTNEIGPHGLTYTEKLMNYEKANYAIQILSLTSLGFSKISVLCFYRRVFYVYTRFLMVNNLLMVIIVGWAVSFFFAIVFQCRDPRTIWTTFEWERFECVQTLHIYYALAVSGFITDLLILASPLPVIRQLQMPLETRIAAACIFLLGALVCSAGIARFVVFLRIGSGMEANGHDLTYFTVPVFSWSMIETSLAVVSANLPLLRPLLHRISGSCAWIWSSIRSTRPPSPQVSTMESSVPELEQMKDKESIRSFFSFELGPRAREITESPETRSNVSQNI